MAARSEAALFFIEADMFSHYTVFKNRMVFPLVAVLWIRDDLARIRILPFKPGQLNNCQIWSVYQHNGTAARFLKHFLDFLMKYVPMQLKTNWTIMKKNLQNFYSFSCQKSQIRIQIRYNYSGSN